MGKHKHRHLGAGPSVADILTPFLDATLRAA